MIIWLDKAAVLIIHDRQLAEHGGSPGVRDDGLLESALGRPQQRYAYGDPPPDLAELAAALAFGLARNHPFIDGNKRTAHVSYRTFLLLNGAELNATDEEKYVAILALAEGKLPEADFAAWLRERITMPPPGAVHEPKARGTQKKRSSGRKRAAFLKRIAKAARAAGEDTIAVAEEALPLDNEALTLGFTQWASAADEAAFRNL